MVYRFALVGNLWNRSPFLSKKRAHSWTVTQEEMTPLQSSYSSFEEEQGHFEVEDRIWSARDRTVTARTKQYLEESKSSKVEVEELESLLGPWDSDVDFRRILEEAKDKKGCAIFETFSSDCPSEFLVVSRPSAQIVRVNSW